MIDTLINSLTAEEKETLKTRCQKNGTHLHKLINALLEDPAANKADLQKRLGITSNAYFKNLNLAKEEIFEIIKLHMRNSYDDLILANVLHRRGLEVFARKLRHKLITEYERYGWWNVLQELYSIEMMVAYSKCDIKELEKHKTKLLKNQERISQYVRIDKELIVQMAIIERGDLKEKDFKSFEKKLNQLMLEANELGHHIPLFNAMHISYVFYTKYFLDIDKAAAIINDIPGFIKKHSSGIIPFTRAASWLNAANFMTDFATRQSPERYFKEVEKSIGNHGLLFDAQAVLNFCFYYFLQKNLPQFDKYFNQFKNLPADKSFHYKITFLQCLKSYLMKDAKQFNINRNLFYTDSKSRDYNDYDLIIRYLEILLLLQAREHLLADHKLEAAIKFTRRNFTQPRVRVEKEHWQMLGAAISDKLYQAKAPPVYRITGFMMNELKAIS